jgi:hypothetical protein
MLVKWYGHYGDQLPEWRELEVQDKNSAYKELNTHVQARHEIAKSDNPKLQSGPAIIQWFTA